MSVDVIDFPITQLDRIEFPMGALITGYVTTAPPPLVKNSTYDFQLAAQKNGGTFWDLSGASVWILFTDPQGVTTPQVATVANGGAKYPFWLADQVGTWSRAWKIQQSATTQISQPIEFRVVG